MQIEQLFRREILNYPNVIFCPLAQEHTPLYLKWFKDPLVRKNLDKGTPFSDTDIISFVNWATSSNRCHYSIVSYNGKPIGHAGIKGLNDVLSIAEISCVIGEREHLGSGIGIAIVTQFVKDALIQYPKLNEIVFTRLNDLPSKLFSKLGFQKKQENDWNIYSISRRQAEFIVTKCFTQ
ncbi:GNAT family N-acetyltransferase [Candidatus Roizmanbacteria bacterium]|nr:GNAT family N-acetyltransferase [Candidatus Roizmanbacteria bacterium]